jgi:hypothetical protein
MHCREAVLTGRAQLGGAEIRALQHHLLRRCRSDEALQDDLGKLLQHFRVIMKDD